MRVAFCRRGQTLNRFRGQQRSLIVMAARSIRLYNGDGAGSRSVLSAVQTLQRAVIPNIKVCVCNLHSLACVGPLWSECPDLDHSDMRAFSFPCIGQQVSQIGPEELLAGSWQDACLALVMPGGADLPYCRRLNGTGNGIIRGMACPMPLRTNGALLQS